MSSKSLLPLAVAAAAFGSYSSGFAGSVETWTRGDWVLETDTATGGLVRIENARDPRRMNWLREPGRWDRTHWRPDRAPEAATRGGQWGLIETAHTGPLALVRSGKVAANIQEFVYESPVLTVTLRRELLEDGLRESYTFQNTGLVMLDLPLGAVTIRAPLFDQYPDALQSLGARCHVHLWMGGTTAWINATRMGAEAPHLGLIVTEGALAAYSQRGGTHSDRGTFLLHPAAMNILSGKSVTLAWRLFWHEGWDDFLARIGDEAAAVRLSAARYTVQAGEALEITAQAKGSLKGAEISANGLPVATREEGGVLRATIPSSVPGEVLVELRSEKARTWLRANVVASPEALIEARLRFIVAHQQRLAPGDPVDGAYLAYDNETDRQVYVADLNDHNAGRERMAMGVLGALHLPRCRDEAFRQELAASLKRYATFVARELEDESGRVYGTVGRKNAERLYNFPWAAHFHLAMYRALRDTEHLDRMVRVLRSYYAHGGARFYAIGLQITDTLAVLAEAGREAERAELLALFRGHADQILRTDLAYPGSEVNYEQSIVAPAVQLLLEVYLATGEDVYLAGARRQMPVLEAFCGRQPDHRLHQVAIRHWDDFWFGKMKVYGDTFPHYWSAINAMAYACYAKAEGGPAWHQRARAVTWANLSVFTPEGRGSAAHVYAFSTNGVRGERNDPWANDQDWALVYLLMAREIAGHEQE